jgi:hypothetical protein
MTSPCDGATPPTRVPDAPMWARICTLPRAMVAESGAYAPPRRRARAASTLHGPAPANIRYR